MGDDDAEWADAVAAQAWADLRSEVADRSRGEAVQVGLVDLLRGAENLRVGLSDDLVLDLAVAAVGPDWLEGRRRGDGRVVLVPLAALRWVEGLGAPAEPGDQVWRRWMLRSRLRGLARDRTAVSVRVSGCAVVTGTIDGVGADYLRLACHPVDEPRRGGAVRGVRHLPLAALSWVGWG